MTVTIVSALILLGAAWPLADLWVRRPFRRTFPKLAVYLGMALGAYVLTVAVLALLFPQAAQFLALVALVSILFQLWRSRPGYGTGRGLPPGKLTLLPTGAWLDQDFFDKQGKLYGPVFKTSHFTKPMVCVVGLEAGFEALRKYEDDALRPPEAAFARYIPCSYIRSMSQEDHRKYRPILQAAVSSEVNSFHADSIRSIVTRHLGRMCDDGSAALDPYAIDALYETLFLLFYGVAPSAAEQRELRELYRILDVSHQRRATIWAPPDPVVQKTLDRTLQILQIQIDEFVSAPTAPDAPPRSYLEAAWRHAGAGALDRLVLLNLIFLLQVSCADLTGLFAWLLKHMSVHTDWQDRLRRTVDEHGFESVDAAGLGQRMAIETLRLEQSEHIYRKVMKPIEVGGYRIPAGWLFRICVRESHRNSPAFADPKSFNPDRFLNRAHPPNEYAPFGMFRRRCIGVDTAEVVGSILVRVLVENFEWQTLDPGTPEFRGWHWTPGSGFAVRLTRRIAGSRESSGKAPSASRGGAVGQLD